MQQAHTHVEEERKGPIKTVHKDVVFMQSDDVTADMKTGGEQEEEEEEDFCPLFMDGLPSNFAEHSGLAAIASLLHDEEGRETESAQTEEEPSWVNDNSLSTNVLTAVGGGKVKSSLRRGHSRKATNKVKSPYPTQSKKTPTKKATLGEAQLFLNMWKI